MIEKTEPTENSFYFQYSNFEKFMDTLDGIVLVFDNDGSIINANKKALFRLGYGYDEIREMNVFSVHQSDCANEIKGSLKEVAEKGFLKCSMPLRTKNDDIIPVESQITSAIWNGQSVFVCSSTDYSSLAGANETFINAFQSNPNITLITTEIGYRVVEVNKRFESFFQLSKKNVVGRKLEELDLVVDLWHWKVFIKELERNNEVSGFELQLKDTNGAKYYFSVSVGNLKFGNQNCKVFVLDDVSFRIKIEDKLIKSEQRYKHLIDFLPEMIFEAGLDGQLTYINKRMWEKLGYDNKRMISGTTIYDFMNPGESRRFKKIITDFDHLKSVPPDEFIVKTKSGEEMPVILYIDAVYNNTGTIKGIRGVMDDITDRKKHELAVLKNLSHQELLSTISQIFNQPSGFNVNLFKTLQTIETSFNLSGVDFFYKKNGDGYGQVSASKINVLLSKGTGANAIKKLFQHIENIGEKFIGHSKIGKLALSCHNKSNCYNIFSVKVGAKVVGLLQLTIGKKTSDLESDIIRVMGNISDIISHAFQRQEYQVNLKTKEATKRGLINSIPDLVLQLNEKGEIVDYNYVEFAAIDFSKNNYKKQPIEKVFPKPMAEILVDGNQKCIKKSSFLTDFQISINKEVLSFEARFNKINITETVVLIRDVSNLKKQSQELEKAKEKAELASQTKSEFLANMSHEIRTPLNAIMGFGEVLMDKLKDGVYKSHIGAILSSSRTLLSLINDILDLSKVEAGRLEINNEPVSLHAIFSEIEQIFNIKVVEKSLSFYNQISSDVPSFLMLDEVRIRQILFNLVGNAIKFTEAGHISLNAHYEPEKDKGCGKLSIIVEDSGIGIPRAQQRLIFDAFKQQSVQISKKYGGTGLGLTITKKLVERMDGRVMLESRLWKGTKFTIELPQIYVPSYNDTQYVSGKLDVETSVVFQEATIAIIDDINFNIDAVKQLLYTSKNLKFLTFNNGRSALRGLAKEIPDIVLLDIRMPGMDGFKVLEKLKSVRNFKNVPILAFTASLYTKKDLINESGFDGMISKPTTRNDLYAELKKFIKYQPLNVENEKEDDQHTEDYKMGFEDAKQLYGVIKSEVYPKWERIKDDLIIFDIDEFASCIIDTAKKFKSPFFEKYGNILKDDVAAFDIGQLEKDLNVFPEIVEKVKTNLK